MLECQCGCHNSATTHWKDYYWYDGVMGTVGVDLDETSVTMESKANEDWLDDLGYDYAEPTYQQKMEMRTFVQKNFVPVQKQTSVPEYGDDEWEYTRDSADFGEHYDIRCKLCGRVFDAGADKNGVAEQHVRSEHSIDALSLHGNFLFRTKPE